MKRSTMLFFLVCLTVMMENATVAKTQPATAETYWPTQDWRTSTPEAQGMDAQKLAQIIVTTADLAGHDEIFKLIEQYIVPAI